MHVRRRVPRAFLGALCLVLGACAGPALSTTGQTPAKADAGRPVGRADVDYLAIGPRELIAAIEPLLAHRQARGLSVQRIALEDLKKTVNLGEKNAGAPIVEAIRDVASRAGKRLRFVLLVGDAPGFEEPGPNLLPTFYRRKLSYDNDEPRGYTHRWRRWAEETYATDLPYAYAHVDAPGQPELAQKKNPRPLAVGRIPARSAFDVADFARKVIRYETSPAEGSWRRSMTIFTGPANFRPIADFMIENTMTRQLDENVPYDWDVEIVFLKIGSPWAYPFPKLQQKLMSRLNAGALIAGYVGHGSPTRFDDVRFQHHWYPIGDSWDMERVHVSEGNPFFISITCHNGFFDLRGGYRSIAETLVLNPRGAIAAFASSRESHPYPNALYGEAIVQTFIAERAPSIGEGIVTAKQRMREGSMPLAPLLFQSDPAELAEEHVGLYNLLGDPATALRYPVKVGLSLDQEHTQLAPETTVTVTVDSPDVAAGKALLTVETRRSVVRAPIQSAIALEAMPEERVWEAMQKTYEAASNKVVSRDEQPVVSGKTTFKVKLPAEPGEYAIKVLVSGNGETGAGHVRLKVASPAPP